MIEPTESKDSVKGFTNDSNVYIVYANKKAYPQFYVRYRLREGEEESKGHQN